MKMEVAEPNFIMHIFDSSQLLSKWRSCDPDNEFGRTDWVGSAAVAKCKGLCAQVVVQSWCRAGVELLH